MLSGTLNFSPLNSYTLRAFPYQQRPVNKITPWEQGVLDLINQTGAAAYNQLISNDLSVSRQHKLIRKLDSLNKTGLMRKYQLLDTNGQEINIAASKPYSEAHSLLDSLLLTQLCKKLKPFDACLEIYLLESQISQANLKFLNNCFAVIIIKNNIPLLPLLTAGKTILIAEKCDPDFNRIKTPVRIILQEDLFSDNPEILFYLPDGSREEFNWGAL